MSCGSRNVLVACIHVLALAATAHPQLPPGTVLDHTVTSLGSGGFVEGLDEAEGFGGAVAWIDDLDGDGMRDLLVGAPSSNDYDSGGAGDPGGLDTGALWILSLLDEAASVKALKISETTPLIGADLWPIYGAFGGAACAGDDFDGNGVRELLVTSTGDEQAGPGAGALYIVRLDSRGSVLGYSLVLPGGPLMPFGNGEGGKFGGSVCVLGDLDGDGYSEVAVAEPSYLVQPSMFGIPGVYGAVRIVFLGPDAVLMKSVTITTGLGGFTGQIDTAGFGTAVAALGDLDGDGVTELAVGAAFDDDGGSDRGAVWILFLNTSGEVKSQAKISSTEGGFTGVLDDGDNFGTSLAPLGDLDGNGTPDVAVGADWDDDGGNARGAVWLLRLQTDGSVASWTKLSSTTTSWLADLQDEEHFGTSLPPESALEGGWLAVGTSRKLYPSDVFSTVGAVRMLRLRSDGIVMEAKLFDVGNTPALEGTVPGNLGHAATMTADDGGDGQPDLLYLSAGKAGRMELQTNGTLLAKPPLIQLSPLGGQAGLDSMAMIGDVDGDGVPDVASGDGNYNQVNIALLDESGMIKRSVTLGNGVGGFPAELEYFEKFGQSVCPLGDVNLDGTPDIAVGAPDDDGPPWMYKPLSGAVWIILLEPAGTALAARKIGAAELGLVASPDQTGGRFGWALANLGDLNLDGFTDIAVGAPLLETVDFLPGVVWILFLGPGGVLQDAEPFDLAGAYVPVSNEFASSLATIRDLDGDDVPELASCVSSTDYQPSGALLIHFLDRDGSVKSTLMNEGSMLGFDMEPGPKVISAGLSGAPGGQPGQWLLVGRPGNPGDFVSVLLAQSP